MIVRVTALLYILYLRLLYGPLSLGPSSAQSLVPGPYSYSHRALHTGRARYSILGARTGTTPSTRTGVDVQWLKKSFLNR